MDEGLPSSDPQPVEPTVPPPLHPPHPLLAAALAFGLFITLGATTQLLNPSFGVWFTEVFIFLGLAWVMLRRAGFRPAEYTGLTPFLGKPALFGFLLGVANFFAVVVPLQFMAQRVAPPWLREMFDASRLFEGQTPVELALLLGGVSVAAPLCEEFFFRGLFQRALTPPAPASPWPALIISSVVFSAFHLDPVGFLARAELGLLFGWLLLRTGSLWPSIAAHAANNMVSSVLFLVATHSGLAKDTGTDDVTDWRAVLGLALVGWTALLGLRAAARHVPSVWGRGTPPDEEAVRATKPVPLFAVQLLPWVAAATLSLVALALVDGRGVSLSVYDIQHPVPPLAKDADPGLQAERKALQQLRKSVRKGEMPMELYEEERLRQSKAHAPELKGERP
ncbi:type II CAAX endopeptidase family protein [Corallococcus sp. bb12-1]|uniref:type II CAAX endopeptidase family protein n=1 Tax=Corallococcus sp. bb12-1 TaxID=2996784 RepID=UPI002270B189|nr:type II CAAX endopeptidase family protein [Corallococcus sp. bb12-1]MCY1041807.1 type II CAAX endopeptidase family protein [Corallococcus sp. bb12-1]